MIFNWLGVLFIAIAIAIVFPVNWIGEAP